ncbi:hypothetical protein L596_015968 [Steinernema carpocapsae]|uniref:Uncharacterized protein n=1 Tax=Steinernema carpocapsae TaxID=34508 RepID=A0A4U5NHS8_STECR|nr:hypothetical protein L596_015968 [Steinernema carpocapsae]
MRCFNGIYQPSLYVQEYQYKLRLQGFGDSAKGFPAPPAILRGIEETEDDVEEALYVPRTAPRGLRSAGRPVTLQRFLKCRDLRRPAGAIQNTSDGVSGSFDGRVAMALASMLASAI